MNARLPTAEPPSVTILLSAFNGARFIEEQLASLDAQAHAAWRLCWRDDGSVDGTRTAIEAIRANP